MVRAAAVIAMLAFSAPAYPQDVFGERENIVVGPDASGSLWMIRAEDFAKRTSDGMTGWLEIDHRKDKSELARRSMMRVNIACGPRTLAIYQSVRYAASGAVLGTYRNPYAAINTDPAVPGSIGDYVIAEVCDKK